MNRRDNVGLAFVVGISLVCKMSRDLMASEREPLSSSFNSGLARQQQRMSNSQESHPSFTDVMELKRRLPDVSETTISHFLAICNGNREECYHKLKTGEWTVREMYEPHQLPDLLPQLPSRSSTLSGYQHRHDRLHRTRTYGPDKTYHRDTPHVKDLSASVNFPSGWSTYRRTNARADMYPGGMPPSMSGIYPPFQAPTTGDLTSSQGRQLEEIHRYRDQLVNELSLLRSQTDEKKHRLTKLRVEASQGPTHQDVGSVRDLITTLHDDIQSVKHKMHMEKEREKMRANQDLYTEEGVRWQCSHCSFLNHPLMSRCEACELPNTTSKHPPGTIPS